ncbi:MAG TPA: N-acetylglucosamine-6-phosphate deacetylase [Stellaceae bacterium]|jgi:N-acetylglucosamine-6-phosphate deacetylase|nr:N-acetylglucosamine-6-phosphate deacetylase [Stellaceae bacterium]
MHAVAADTVFDGTRIHSGCAVLIEGADIVGLVARAETQAGVPVRNMPSGAWLAPGFIDVQVNGGGDVLFNDSPNPQAIATIAAAHRRFGTTGFLPTLISDNAATMRAASDAADAAAAVLPGVLGVHFEGPFVSPERAGVHDRAMLRQPTPNDLALLTQPRRGVTLATVAPECLPVGFIEHLVAAGIRVSLGHSMATYDETRAAIDAGMTGFTHLFNAMRPMTAREPGPIAAALEDTRAFYGLIVDGVHVAPAMLRLALRSAGRAMLVTDAMPPVGGLQPHFRLAGKAVEAHDGRCATADGTLAGSVLDMASAVRNCIGLLGLDLPQALTLASATPADFLGLGHRLGRLAPGYRADMVAFEPADIGVLATWVAGEDDSDRAQ